MMSEKFNEIADEKGIKEAIIFAAESLGLDLTIIEALKGTR